jgi:hypothetical protein
MQNTFKKFFEIMSVLVVTLTFSFLALSFSFADGSEIFGNINTSSWPAATSVIPTYYYFPNETVATPVIQSYIQPYTQPIPSVPVPVTRSDSYRSNFVNGMQITFPQNNSYSYGVSMQTHCVNNVCTVTGGAVDDNQARQINEQVKANAKAIQENIRAQINAQLNASGI